MNPAPDGGPPPPEPTRAPGAPVRLVVRALLLVGGVAAALGVPYGLLWANLAPKIPVVKVDGGLVPADQAPEQFVGGDGWFLLLGIGFGLLAGITAWTLGRSARGPVAVLVLAIGGTVGGVVAWWLGRQIGLHGYEQALAAAPVGTTLEHPAALRVREITWYRGFLPNIRGVLLVEAFVAVVTYTLLAGWSRFPSLRPEPPVPVPPVAGAPPPWAEQYPGERELSSDWWARPDPPSTPERPVSGEAGPPRGSAG